MRKLHLAAIDSERDGILNALQRTNAVEIREHADMEGTRALPESGEELRAYLSTLENTLSVLSSAAESASDGKKEKGQDIADGFSVTYEEFAGAAERREWADTLVRRVNAVLDEKSACLSEQASLSREIALAKPYAGISHPFSRYSGSLHVKVKLGTVAPTAWENLKKALEELPLVAYEAETSAESVLLIVSVHKSAYLAAEELLNAAGFSSCPYKGEMTGAELLKSLEEKLDKVRERQRQAEEELLSLTSELRTLKIYCDYVGFELEKAEAAGKMRATERTFFLEAFVPESEEEKVKTALETASSAIWYEFSDPAEDEEVPTLLMNNPVVSNFETITNMYSPPNAREMDPNTVMSFFYSLFMGFIMADIGYGIIMLLGGGFLWWKKKGGIKSLAGVFAVCGIFTIFWGFLFNSLLGMQVLPFTIMPDAQTQMYSLSGISLPGVLVISLLLGVVQLMAGYLCKAAQCWRRGFFWDGVFDGVVWAVFSLGAGLAVVGLIEDFNLSFLALAGGIIAGASLVVAVFTAGRKEKFLGKFTKGFGSLYGLINYFTDVLSYIRLYGLMLTGAVIAQVVSQYSVSFLTSGSVLIVLGAILMVVGHLFNLAIGLLGAYIHTARLQYVEFFGRFYEGEGELFTPLGSQQKYISLEKK